MVFSAALAFGAAAAQSSPARRWPLHALRHWANRATGHAHPYAVARRRTGLRQSDAGLEWRSVLGWAVEEREDRCRTKQHRFAGNAVSVGLEEPRLCRCLCTALCGEPWPQV